MSFDDWLHQTILELRKRQDALYLITAKRCQFFLDIPEELWIYAQAWILQRMAPILRPDNLKFKSFVYGDVIIRKAR
jgi:hypothetical protein